MAGRRRAGRRSRGGSGWGRCLDSPACQNSRTIARGGGLRPSNHSSDAQAAAMNASLARKRTGERGFTLIETLVAVALTGLVLSPLANITSQWLQNWNRGLDRIQRNESVSLALQRIGADLSAAEYVPANREQRQPLFDGSELSVTFVRTALGPNAGPGLDVVRVGETTDRQGLVTVRSRAPFRPLPLASSLSEQIHFGGPVVL